MRPRSFCDTRSIRSNCFPGAGLIRSHRCKRRRCTDGGCRRPCPPCRSLALWRRKLRIRPGAPQRLPARRCAIRPLGNDHHDLKGIEDGEQEERSPRAGATRHPSPPFSAHQPSGQKRESRAFPPQNGVHPPFPPQPKLPGCTGDNQGPHRQNCGGEVRRWVIGQARAIQKRPPRAESGKGVSNDLWQRPTFPHDVMQYHRRWRA